MVNPWALESVPGRLLCDGEKVATSYSPTSSPPTPGFSPVRAPPPGSPRRSRPSRPVPALPPGRPKRGTSRRALRPRGRHRSGRRGSGGASGWYRSTAAPVCTAPPAGRGPFRLLLSSGPLRPSDPSSASGSPASDQLAAPLGPTALGPVCLTASPQSLSVFAKGRKRSSSATVSPGLSSLQMGRWARLVLPPPHHSQGLEGNLVS